MNFLEAMKAVKDGHRIRLEDGSHALSLNSAGLVRYTHDMDYDNRPQFHINNILTDEWEIVSDSRIKDESCVKTRESVVESCNKDSVAKDGNSLADVFAKYPDMFSDDVESVLRHAESMAIRLSNGIMSSTHVLLGLLEHGYLAKKNLSDMQIDIQLLKQRLEELIAPNVSANQDCVLSVYAHTVVVLEIIDRAMESKSKLDFCNSRDLLLALLRTKCGASDFLSEFGVTYERMFGINNPPVEVKSGMTFTEAINLVLDGKKVRRESMRENWYLFLAEGGVVRAGRTNSDEVESYLIFNEDVTATDWMMVDVETMSFTDAFELAKDGYPIARLAWRDAYGDEKRYARIMPGSHELWQYVDDKATIPLIVNAELLEADDWYALD
jgi:hypothetical protein